MKTWFEAIKSGFGTAISELFKFIIRIVTSMYVLWPMALFDSIPLLIRSIPLMVDNNCNPLVISVIFKISFVVSQILALSVSMTILKDSSESEGLPIPSKDLIVGMYLLISFYVLKTF